MCGSLSSWRSGRRMTGRAEASGPSVALRRPRAAAASSSSSPTVFVALPIGRRRLRRSAATSRSRKMIVWPVVSSSPMTANSRTALTRVRPVPGHAERREDHEQHEHARPGTRSSRGPGRARPRGRRPCTGRGRWDEVAGAASGRRSDPGSGRRSGSRVGSASGSSSVTSPNDTGGGVRPPADPVARPSTTSTPGSASRIDGGASTFHDRDPPPSDDALALHHAGVDPDRQRCRQPEHRHAADLHPGDLAGRLGRRERRLARAEPIADGAVDVEPIRREDDARRVARRVALADDEDRVRRVLRCEAVGRAERRGVGEGRVAREQLVVDAQPLERGDQPFAALGIVRGGVDPDDVGHARKRSRYHRGR